MVSFIGEAWHHGLNVIYKMPVYDDKSDKQLFIEQAMMGSLNACFDDLDRWLTNDIKLIYDINKNIRIIVANFCLLDVNNDIDLTIKYHHQITPISPFVLKGYALTDQFSKFCYLPLA